MKKVLIIANIPHASPRLPGVLEYLRDYGWEAVVITPAAEGLEGMARREGKAELHGHSIVEAHYGGDIFQWLRRILKSRGMTEKESFTEQVRGRLGCGRKLADTAFYLYSAVMAFPDTERTWLRPAVEAALETARGEKFDAVLSSIPFPTSHCAAAEVKRRTGIPWVADYRDLWSQNHNYPYPAMRRALDRMKELRTLRSADAVITVSQPWAKKLGVLLGRKVDVITNGFRPPAVAPPRPANNKLTVFYTGTIYEGRQNPEIFLSALARLVSKGLIAREKIRVGFYGPRYGWLERLILKHGLRDVVLQLGKVPKKEVAVLQASADVLLLLNWEDPEEKGVIPGKLFEYFCADRRILATGGYEGDVVDRIMHETSAGVAARDAAAAADRLLEIYSEFLAAGSVKSVTKREEIEKYSYRELSGRFAAVLDRAARLGPGD